MTAMIAKTRAARNWPSEHGTPLFVVDHDAVAPQLRRSSRSYLPRVQAYYAVKANSDPAIVQDALTRRAQLRRRLDAGVPDRPREHQGPAGQGAAGLDLGQDHLRQPDQGRPRRCEELDQYKPLVTYDNFEEIQKIKKYAPHAGLALRLKVPNTGAMVELSSKFGAAPGRGGGPDPRGRQGRA